MNKITWLCGYEHMPDGDKQKLSVQDTGHCWSEQLYYSAERNTILPIYTISRQLLWVVRKKGEIIGDARTLEDAMKIAETDHAEA